jgi:hypothetical protein
MARNLVEHFSPSISSFKRLDGIVQLVEVLFGPLDLVRVRHARASRCFKPAILRL